VARQLELFRKAVRNEGRWLARENYIATLRAIVIMEIDQQDYPSAVRDYDLLTETPVGKEMAKDLENVIEIIRAQMAEHDFQWQPYIHRNRMRRAAASDPCNGSKFQHSGCHDLSDAVVYIG
jgi:hypothetical protein